MCSNNDRIEMILTFTISRPYRVKDTDKSFNAAMERIISQPNSFIIITVLSYYVVLFVYS